MLEFVLKKFPTDSDKIRQTRAEQVITPKNPPKPSKNFSLYNYPGLRYDRCVNFGKEMYASMVNGYENVNSWHNSCNQPTNLSYLNKKVVFAYNQTEYTENTRLLLPARSQGRRGLFVCVKLGAHIIN